MRLSISIITLVFCFFFTFLISLMGKNWVHKNIWLILWIKYFVTFRGLHHHPLVAYLLSVIRLGGNWERCWFISGDTHLCFLSEMLSHSPSFSLPSGGFALLALILGFRSCLHLLSFRVPITSAYRVALSNYSDSCKRVWPCRVLGSLRPTEGAPWKHLKCWSGGYTFVTPSPRYALSSVHCALWKGETTGWEWDVLTPLINVTVSEPSSLMWNRHLESVAHAVRKRVMCWWRKSILRGFANYGPTSVSNSFVLSRGPRYEIWNSRLFSKPC